MKDLPDFGFDVYLSIEHGQCIFSIRYLWSFKTTVDQISAEEVGSNAYLNYDMRLCLHAISPYATISF